jgi:glycosyltransferase involved in cell wall biosynthesis
MADGFDLALLKSPDFAAWRREYGGPDGTELPYRLDHLEADGIRLRWTDAPHRPPWTGEHIASGVRRAESLGAPFVQTMALTGAIATSPVTLAMFESEGHFLAGLRWARVWPYTRTKLVIVSCWLAELLPQLSPARLLWYRRLYRHVDRLVYLSANQGPVLRDLLELPAARLAYVPLGIDAEFFAPNGSPDGGYVLAVGRDRGRDWPTFFSAVTHTELPVRVLCRPGDIAGLHVPPNVEVLGYVDRHRYRELTHGARVVVVPTKVLSYATGQSVLLEAMASAKACVVTDTPAMADYVDPDRTAVVVPPGDAEALTRAISRLAADGALRRQIGQQALTAVESNFTARVMWARIGTIAAELARQP